MSKLSFHEDDESDLEWYEEDMDDDLEMLDE